MRQDDYLPCEAYLNQPKHATETRFSAFHDTKTNRFYFALLGENGAVLLKSEGYPQEKTRENGISSVLKNLPLRERFAVVSEGKEYFVALRAGNRQEIARSCGFTTSTAAESFIESFFAAPKVEAKKVAAPKVAVAAAKTVVAPTVEVTAEPVVAVKIEAKKAVAPKAEVKTAPAQSGVKVFLHTEAYLGHPTLTDVYGPTGYATFKGPDTKYYFTVYNPDGSIYLRSVGFENENLRDEELTSVQFNILDPEKYHVVEEVAEQFAVALVDNSKRELARSTRFDSFTAAFVTTPKGRTRTEGVNLF